MTDTATKIVSLLCLSVIWFAFMILSGLVLGGGIDVFIAPTVITLLLGIVFFITDQSLESIGAYTRAIFALSIGIYFVVFFVIKIPDIVHWIGVFFWYIVGVPLVSLIAFVETVSYLASAIVLGPAVVLTVGISLTVWRTGRAVEWSLILRMLASMLMLGVLTVVFITAVWRFIEFVVSFGLSLVGIDPSTRLFVARVITGGLLAAFVYLQLGRTTAVERHGDATPVPPDENPTLHSITAKVASQLDVPMPTIAIAEHSEPEAITVGYPGNIPLILSQGTLDLLDSEELEAVVAHELAHVANMDAMVTTVAAIPLLLADGLYPSLDSSSSTSSSEDDDSWDEYSGSEDTNTADTYQIDQDDTDNMDAERGGTDNMDAERGRFSTAFRVIAFLPELIVGLLSWLLKSFLGFVISTLFKYLVGIYVYLQIPLLVIALITKYIGRPIVAIISRTRESAADHTAATVTGSPAALASALRTLDEQIDATPSDDLREASCLSSLSILSLDPMKADADDDIVATLARIKETLFATHPPTAQRINTLTYLAEKEDEGNREYIK